MVKRYESTIQAAVSSDMAAKFKIMAAESGVSMPEFCRLVFESAISRYEEAKGEIDISEHEEAKKDIDWLDA